MTDDKKENIFAWFILGKSSKEEIENCMPFQVCLKDNTTNKQYNIVFEKGEHPKIIK